MPTTGTITITGADAGEEVTVSSADTSKVTVSPVGQPADGTGAATFTATNHASTAANVNLVVSAANKTSVTIPVTIAAPTASNQPLLDMIAATGTDTNWPAAYDTHYGVTKDGSNKVSAIADGRLSSAGVGSLTPVNAGILPTFDSATNMVYGNGVNTPNASSTLASAAAAALDLATDAYVVMIAVCDNTAAVDRYIGGLVDNALGLNRFVLAQLAQATANLVKGVVKNASGTVISTGVATAAGTVRVIVVKGGASAPSAQVLNHAAGTDTNAGAQATGNNRIVFGGLDGSAASGAKIGFLGIARTLTSGNLTTILNYAVSQFGAVAAT